MEIPLVSIIIPAYNSKAFIEETIESALQQTYNNIEIILVNDGSTDGIEELFGGFQRQGVLCFTIENSGASNARNFGFLKSQGAFIQYLDADDLLHPHKIAKQIESMRKNNATICFSKWVMFENHIEDSQMFKFSKVNYLNPKNGKELLFSFGMENWFVPPISWLTSRNLIEKAGLWNVEISNNDDGEFFFRVLYNAEKVICIDEVYSYYRVLETNSLSKLNSTTKINSAYTSYRLIEELLLNNYHKELMCYPKRLYYTHYLMIRNDFPELAKRSAKAFDQLRTDCFLSRKKKYWIIINWFGLYKGTLIYDFVLKVLFNIKRI
ncbi:glycosyltransferase family 2 protein [Flavobacterium taihuense]|uniref:Glycosyltransferase family 2 protein n=1 Tax=Flavobacterium taihuense TaxID=2857508 RepID=A0ABS6XVI2_9FLAO|nr:glycosyltransferase family 2 protein [Flavobacterium taihuense]MBW4360367.1 glycosyltransferase family 2 protein [Flavobacterium taihuense]